MAGSPLAGMAVLVMVVSLGAGWAFRMLLLKRLRTKYPQEFAALGEPNRRHLNSLLPRHHEVQLGFWKYLWGESAFQLKDPTVSALTWSARVSDVALTAGLLVLLLTVAAR